MTAPSIEIDADGASRLPRNPFANHLRFSPIEFGEGTAKLELTVEEIHLRPGDLLHGGVYAAMLDTVTGYAAYSVAPKGAEVLTMQLNLNMTSTAKRGDKVVAVARVAHSGRRTAVVTGEIRRGDDKLLATGSATLFFVEGKLKS